MTTTSNHTSDAPTVGQAPTPTAPTPTAPTPAAQDLRALRTACDRLVATAADPAAARSVLLRMWALGAAAADDLLDDLCRAAQRHAARTGTEASPVELLDALGHHQLAAALDRASSRGLAEHDEATAQAQAQAQRAVEAARAVARLAQVDHHRRGATADLTAAHAA